jgi:hypothetical protein
MKVMSGNANAVKKWRNETKKRIVESMGGECCICGYNKCDKSLALHHLDPSKKEISFGAIRANPKKWDKIVSELKKCILVCHNCHSEIHAGVTLVPDVVPKFNEMFSDYRKLTKSLNTKKCPICDTYMLPTQITCSLVCAGKRHRRVDWDSINLKVELETKSYAKLADELGISNAAVSKRAKKLGLKSKFC